MLLISFSQCFIQLNWSTDIWYIDSKFWMWRRLRGTWHLQFQIRIFQRYTTSCSWRWMHAKLIHGTLARGIKIMNVPASCGTRQPSPKILMCRFKFPMLNACQTDPHQIYTLILNYECSIILWNATTTISKTKFQISMFVTRPHHSYALTVRNR